MTNKKQVNLHHGNCLDVLKKLPDNSIDSVVTDPPYGLSFMGKKWDYDVPSVDIWKECLRVLKPGGHLLAFAGTRTQHRMCVRIEDAGFEIRDMLAWVYGSGFPKSLDVSKAIDKNNGETGRLLKFTEWMRTTGLNAKEINECTKTFMGSHYLTSGSQPAIPTPEIWKTLRPLCKEVPEWVDELVRRIGAERDVVGKKDWSNSSNHFLPGEDHKQRVNLDITAPATDSAKKWSGWGTALKPALEPITLARKPLIGTVADNVLTHGTGAINVESGRVGVEGRAIKLGVKGTSSHEGQGFGCDGKIAKVEDYDWESYGMPKPSQGRWPANFIHDGGEEINDILGDSSRFFYCAKTSKKDREEGLQSFEDKKASGLPMRAAGGERKGEGIDGTKTDRETTRKNTHPTVKPTDLMRYLCKLITPPGGVILDPFMGSGSTGKAAVLEGFKFTGIELDADYLKIAKARIEHATLENKKKKVSKNV